MPSFERLEELLRDFPGIGPRQAKRFALFLLSRKASYRRELAQLIASIDTKVSQCSLCFRFYGKSERDRGLCSICANPSRDPGLLMLVEKDVDVDALERGGFTGRYFVLGGTIPLATETPREYARIPELTARIRSALEQGLREIIFGLSATTEGDHTRLVLDEIIASIAPGLRKTILGRGLSTGSEIEYADPETIRQALGSRR